MERPERVLLAIAVCLTALLSGCGSSSHPPPSPLSITTTTVMQGVVNSPYSATLSATGGLTPYAWNVASGNLPPGLSLSRGGVISGTPTASGGFSFGVTVLDSEMPPSVANGNFSITIVPALQISTTSLSNGSPSVFYSATLAAMGGIPPYSWTITQGSLPSGFTLNATSGVISGTPANMGRSSFTVQVSDAETPAGTTAASLSIVINPPPPRNAALYTDGGFAQLPQTGLQIQSDGSLTLLPSSPESAITGTLFASSPKLPLLFMVSNQTTLQSLLVNPDYSLTSYSTSAPLPVAVFGYGRPSVDPSGSNLYLPGPLDSSGTTGVTIFPGNGSLQPLGNMAIPNVTGSSSLVFTPDGTLAFISTCDSSNTGRILSYSRSADGMLSAAPTSVLQGSCFSTLTVSPDGRYLGSSEVQVYSISSNGTLTAVLPQPFTVLTSPLGISTVPNDMTWDESSSFLLVSTSGGGLGFIYGVAVLSFSGSNLVETAFPTGGNAGRIQQIGSRVYSMGLCQCFVPYKIFGYDFQNGQLIPLPGSPYQYGNSGDMVIY